MRRRKKRGEKGVKRDEGKDSVDDKFIDCETRETSFDRLC